MTAWASRILTGLSDGSQMRIPLSVFYSTALRRELELERELADGGRSPRWHEARPSLDDAGRLERVVPVAKRSTVDDGWDDAGA